MCRPAFVVVLIQAHMITEWKGHNYSQAERKAFAIAAEQGVPAVLERSDTTPDRGRKWVIDCTKREKTRGAS